MKLDFKGSGWKPTLAVIPAASSEGGTEAVAEVTLTSEERDASVLDGDDARRGLRRLTTGAQPLSPPSDQWWLPIGGG
jgi:hypothetical protein